MNAEISSEDDRDRKVPKFRGAFRPYLALGSCAYLHSAPWRDDVRSTLKLKATNWPAELGLLRNWLRNRGVDLTLHRSESEILQLVRLIGHIQFSPKQRSKPVRDRLMLAQNKLCLPQTKSLTLGRGRPVGSGSSAPPSPSQVSS